MDPYVIAKTLLKIDNIMRHILTFRKKNQANVFYTPFWARNYQKGYKH